MKKKIGIVSNNQIKKVNNSLMAADTIIYEVSRRPHNKHKRQLAANANNLRTPSGGKVPPAWTQVWITSDPHSHIQAIGRDTKDRRVYLYSAEHMGRASAAKFSRLKAFTEVYPRLIKKIQRDKHISEEARALYLIAKTGFRIGSDSETRATVKAFGASTLKCSQVKVEGQGSSKFTVKDFRTYLGTLTALQKIKHLPAPQSSSEYKKYREVVGESVARELGNSSSVALKSYVAPEVFCDWETRLPEPLKKFSGKSTLNRDFFECVHYDQEVPQEEYTDTDASEQSE